MRQRGDPHGLRRTRPSRTALEAFTADYRQKTALNRKILDHLLHDAFGDDDRPEPEVDLVLDPDPPPERIAEVLGPLSRSATSPRPTTT